MIRLGQAPEPTRVTWPTVVGPSPTAALEPGNAVALTVVAAVQRRPTMRAIVFDNVTAQLGALPVAARSVLTPMLARTRAISRMVEDMLDDARFHDGRLHLYRRPADVRTVVQETVDDAGPGLSAALELQVHLPGEPVVADVDPGRVSTIVRNLIDNAIKYSPAGGVIDCTVESGGGMAVITVSDQGIGIDPEQAGQLFQRFERGRANGRLVTGVGLGLYIARALARLHGGDISVTGRQLGGTQFVVTLPLEL